MSKRSVGRGPPSSPQGVSRKTKGGPLYRDLSENEIETKVYLTSEVTPLVSVGDACVIHLAYWLPSLV